MPKKQIQTSDIAQFTPHRRIVMGGTIDFMPQTSSISKYTLPRRPVDESLKICRRHNRRQSRTIQVIGPITDAQMIVIRMNEVAAGKREEFLPREPRSSHKPHWKKFFITRWLVAPLPGLVYVTFGTAKCPDCTESNEEKAYYRPLGRLNLFTLRYQIFLRSWIPFFEDSYSLAPYDQSKTLREHVKM
jgi:hypothetical protein